MLINKPPLSFITNWKSNATVHDLWFYFLAKIFPGIVTFVFLAAAVKTMTNSGYGHWAYIMSCIVFASTLCFGWITQSILCFYSGTSHIYNRALMYKLLGPSMITGMAIFLAAMIFRRTDALFPNTIFLMMTACAIVAGEGCFMVIIAMLRAGRHSRLFFIISSLKAFLTLSLAIAGSWVSGIQLALVFYCIGLFIALAVSFGYIRQVFTFNEESPAASGTKMFRFGISLSVWLGLSALLPLLDRSFLMHFLGAENTGVYSALYEFTIRSFSVILFPVTLTVHPIIMGAYNNKQKQKAINYTLMSLAFMATVAACYLLVLYYIFPYLMHYLNVKDIVSGRQTGMLLGIGGSFWQLALIAHKPLEMIQKTGVMIKIMLLALALHFSILLMLIKPLGIISPAVAYCSSGFLYLVCCLIFSHKLLKARSNKA